MNLIMAISGNTLATLFLRWYLVDIYIQTHIPSSRHAAVLKMVSLSLAFHSQVCGGGGWPGYSVFRGKTDDRMIVNPCSRTILYCTLVRSLMDVILQRICWNSGHRGLTCDRSSTQSDDVQLHPGVLVASRLTTGSPEKQHKYTLSMKSRKIQLSKPTRLLFAQVPLDAAPHKARP